MVNHLHEISSRILAVEAARPVPVSARSRPDGHTPAHKELMPCVHIRRAAEQEPNMIQTLIALRSEVPGGPVEGQVVGP